MALVYEWNGIINALEELQEKGVPVRTIITEEIAKIIADAPEDLDTLKEISTWIEEHADDAAAMNLEIQTLKTDKANKTDVYTKTEIDTKMDTKLSKSDSVTVTQAEFDTLSAAGELTALEYNIIEE